MSEFFNNQIDSSINEVFHMLIKIIFELFHISSLARLNYFYVLSQLILL